MSVWPIEIGPLLITLLEAEEGTLEDRALMISASVLVDGSDKRSYGQITITGWVFHTCCASYSHLGTLLMAQ